MHPKFFHPSDFNIDGFNYLLTTVGLALLEFEHLFVVDELSKGDFLFLHLLLEFGDASERTLDPSIVEVEAFFFQACLQFFEVILEFLDSILGLDGFNGLGAVDFFLNFGSHKSNCSAFIQKL